MRIRIALLLTSILAFFAIKTFVNSSEDSTKE
jgi:hypothetical protein